MRVTVWTICGRFCSTSNVSGWPVCECIAPPSKQITGVQPACARALHRRYSVQHWHVCACIAPPPMSPRAKPRPSLPASPASAHNLGTAVNGGVEHAFMFSSDCNANLSICIRDALNTIASADVFREIQSALPLGSNSDSDSGSGVHAPFTNAAYWTAMCTHNTYTCSCNLFWCRFDFTPNPGVPIRMTAINQLVDFYFAKPGPMPCPVVITMNDLETDPLTQRGALRAISPEEIRFAMLFAIARDVARCAPVDDLNAWRRYVLSATTQFVHHSTQDDMYFAACQLRENMGSTYHDSMHRTALQRVYEIAHFRESQLKAHGPAAGTSHAVFNAYKRVKTVGKTKPYSLAAIKSSLTIMSRLICIPSVHRRLLDFDASSRGGNPFDSVHKLEALLRKGKDTNRITWLVDMIWYVVQHKGKPPDSDDLSVQGLRGNQTNGHRGYADVLLFKRDCVPYLLNNLPQELGLDASWFTFVARSKMETVAMHLDATRDPTWCANVDKPTMCYLTFCQEFVYGLTYDACIKALVKNNKQVSNLALQPAVTELLADIKHGVLELNMSSAASTSRTVDANGDGDNGHPDLDLDGTQADARCRQLITRHTDAYTLVSKSASNNPDLSASLGNAAAGRYTGPLPVAVIYDTKLHGGSQHRPNIWLPPFQSDDVKVLLKAARDRSRTPHVHGVLPATDLYFLLDGGRADLVLPWQGHQQTTAMSSTNRTTS